MISSRRVSQALLAAAALFRTPPAVARSTAPATPSDDFWSRSNRLGDVGGLRTVLGKCGVTLNIIDNENLPGNRSGGVKQCATLQGVTTATVATDTGKAFGLQGGTFHISALQIHRQSPSGPYLHNLRDRERQ